VSRADIRDLIRDPLWQPGDLGRPIPGSPHSVSVCLPTWQDNIDYEEQEPRVHAELSSGYPRFVYNRWCRDLFAICEIRFAADEEVCLAFPSKIAAERFGSYLHEQSGEPARIHPFGRHGVHAVCFPRRHARTAKGLWQYWGEGVSSRQAQACLDGQAAEDGTEAKETVRRRIARLAGVSTDEVFLFPCGMNAIFTLHRTLSSMLPGRKTVQFGFPYADTLKIQQEFGPGVHFFPRGNEADWKRLEAVLESEQVSGLYSEFPSNPLLISPDLEGLASLARRHGFPLIVDDTIASFVNVDLLPAADVVCSSLTKLFSGRGDVTGGSLVLNPRSPFYPELRLRLRETEDAFWGADAIVLEHNSRDFEPRVPELNRNAAALADYLRVHPRVDEVFYPAFQTTAQYDAFRRPAGGYGPLLSITLQDAPRNAPRFFDALRICKGPNLGTNYSLACPYTILAHYQELNFAESCGVSRHLVRISVGLEEPEELIRRCADALSAL
jgi:cystathionine gamma-synthase